MRYYYRQPSMGFGPRITPAVKYLVIINVAVFVVAFFARVNLSILFGLVPDLFWRGMVWQAVTYMFLHGGFFHILFNMFVVWMFGSALESTWGSRKFLKFYFICGIGAALLNAAITPHSPIPIIGASGAIYGLLMAYGILFPNNLIYIWGIIPLRAKHFVVVLGAIELLTAMSTVRDNIAHFAHLGGMLFGLIYMKWHVIPKYLSRRRDDIHRKRNLRKIWDRERERFNLQSEVDELLGKVRERGVDSLTPEDAERLKRAGERLHDLDREE